MIVSYNSIVYFCASSVAVALVLFLLFNRPDAYAAFYETVYLADGDPGARPKVGLCLSMPFSKENLESLNVPNQLASFLLFALSPFFPKESVIGDQVSSGAVQRVSPTFRESRLRTPSVNNTFGQFGEFFSCSCVPLLSGLACIIHATWGPHFSLAH